MNETNFPSLNNHQVSAPEQRALYDYLKSTGRVGTQIVARYFSVRKLNLFVRNATIMGLIDAAH